MSVHFLLAENAIVACKQHHSRYQPVAACAGVAETYKFKGHK